jgi:hypothetical protein
MRRWRLSHALLAATWLALAGLIWLQSAEYRASGNDVFLLIRNSAVVQLASWGSVAAVMLFVYMAISMAAFNQVLFSSLRASAPTVWLFPSVLLLLTHTPAGAVAGLLLAGNAVRLLCSSRPPSIYRSEKFERADTAPAQPFRLLPSPRPWRASALSAFAFQAGVFCVIEPGYPLVAIVLVATGAAICTRSSITQGASAPRAGSALPHLLFGIPLTVLLMMQPLLQRAPAGADSGVSSPASIESALHILRGSAQGSKSTGHDQPQSATRPITRPKPIGTHGPDTYPGAVLVPETPASERHRIWLVPAPGSVVTIGLGQPHVIPFTGQYHLFPSSYGSLPPGWAIYRGTPLDGLYETLRGRPMETDAYQSLNPPVDFSNCANLLLSLLSQEKSLASATVLLITSSRTYELGVQFFGIFGEAEETLDFAVPDSLRHSRVTAIRVVFRRDVYSRRSDVHSQNARVVVREFRLLSRGQ